LIVGVEFCSGLKEMCLYAFVGNILEEQDSDGSTYAM